MIDPDGAPAPDDRRDALRARKLSTLLPLAQRGYIRLCVAADALVAVLDRPGDDRERIAAEQRLLEANADQKAILLYHPVVDPAADPAAVGLRLIAVWESLDERGKQLYADLCAATDQHHVVAGYSSDHPDRRATETAAAAAYRAMAQYWEEMP